MTKVIKCDKDTRYRVSKDTIQTGMTVHIRQSTAACIPWMVVGETDESPLLGLPGWQIMEIGDETYKNAEGHALGSGMFTGRVATLRPTGLDNFHTHTSE